MVAIRFPIVGISAVVVVLFYKKCCSKKYLLYTNNIHDFLRSNLYLMYECHSFMKMLNICHVVVYDFHWALHSAVYM